MLKVKNDLWIELVGEEFVIGLTPQMQDDAGEIGFAFLASLGAIEEDDTLAELEASKMVMEIPSPLTGRIVAVNEAANERPHILNSSLRSENWLAKLVDVNPADFEALPDFE